MYKNLSYFKKCSCLFIGASLMIIILGLNVMWNFSINISSSFYSSYSSSNFLLSTNLAYDRDYARFDYDKPEKKTFNNLELSNLYHNRMIENYKLFERKIDLSNIHYINSHRSGWNYATNMLELLHRNGGITVIDFIDHYFGYLSHNQPQDIIDKEFTLDHIWIGFWHNPPNMPLWYDYINSPQSVLSQIHFNKSLEYCRGIFVFSYYHYQWLRNYIPLFIPISVVFHPTQLILVQFSWENWLNNEKKKVIQLGWWIRKMTSIYRLNTTYEKMWLYGSEAAFRLLKLEKQQEHHYFNNYINSATGSEVKVINPVNNGEYDILLANNIVFIDLFDSSANNALIECIVRNTPIVITRLPATMEYLGSSYPLFFNTLEEASSLIHNETVLFEGHRYLLEHPELSERISGVHFRDSIAQSEVYSNLFIPKLDLSKVYLNFDHRSGWTYAMKGLKEFERKNHRGIRVIEFIENQFGWKTQGLSLEEDMEDLILHKSWIGFWHNPPNQPEFFEAKETSPSALLEKNILKRSLSHCRGIFVFAKYMQNYLRDKLPMNIPISVLFHPTETNVPKFEWKKYKENSDKLLIQLGWWLRKMNHFYLLKLFRSDMRKMWLYNNANAIKFFKAEQNALQINESQIMMDSIETPLRLSNDEYDQYLTRNIVFLDLYDSTCNNAIIESIVRATPLVINYLPPIVEYLGENYPLYFTTLEEASILISNDTALLAGHEYLISKPYLTERLKLESFIQSIYHSQVYSSL